MRTWFITRAGRGVGASIAERALALGDFVVATARYPSHVKAALGEHERLLVLPLDVTQEQQAHAAVQAALEHVDRIDVLVNSAGYGLLGAIEEASAAEVERVFRTNVFSLLNVTRALLPQLRKQRRGHIVNLSSIGGCQAAAGWGIYHATKLAVEAISEALSKEVEPLGIYTTVVDPGTIRRDFRSAISLLRTAREIDDYEDTACSAETLVTAAAPHVPADHEALVDAILALVDTPDPPGRLRLGGHMLDAFDAHAENTLIREIDPWRSLVLPTDLVG